MRMVICRPHILKFNISTSGACISTCFYRYANYENYYWHSELFCDIIDLARYRYRSVNLKAKTTKRKIIMLILALLMIVVLVSGCFRISADELYALPQISDEYLRLEAHINLLRSQGAEFAPPVRGPNRQAVQLVDLNGTGQNEVIVFFSIPGEESASLQIYIFKLVDGDYEVAEIIEGFGTEIDSVRYVDMNGDGTKELIIGWQMGPALRFMSIYALTDFHSQALVSGVEYSEIAEFDITGDGNNDVVVFRMQTHDTDAVAEIYTLMPDGELAGQEAWLSNGIESISRILPGSLIDGSPAIFVDSEGTFENGSLVTDVFAMHENEFTNVTMDVAGGIRISDGTVRNRMSSADVNKDGVIKVPYLRRLMAQSETVYYAIDWYAFSNTGDSTLALTTYHNNFDEWFLILPFDWRERVSVRRDDTIPGERTIVFSYFTDPAGPYEDFLKIFRISGENAEERASAENRELLMTEGASTFAFELLAPPNSFGLTFDEILIRNNFRLIYSEWLAGRTT